jgi:hypothetical protein
LHIRPGVGQGEVGAGGHPAPLLLPELPPLLPPVLQNQLPGLWQVHVPAFG